MKLEKAIDTRRSHMKFANKKVRWDHILEAIDAANQAPFAGNQNQLQFIIVSSQETKNRLAECAQQLWISEAPFIVVVASDTAKLKKLYQDRGHTYSKQQAGAAIENFLLRITDLKLGACWVGAFDDEHVKRAIELPNNLDVEAIIPIGKPFKKDKPNKPRKKTLEQTIHWGKYGTRKKPAIIEDAPVMT